MNNDTLNQLLREISDGWMVHPKGGCGCQACRQEWRASMLEQTVFALYDKLPELPHQYKMDSYSYGDINRIIMATLDLKEKNKSISKIKKKGQTLSYCRSCGVLHVNNHSLGNLLVCDRCAERLFVCDHCGIIKHRQSSRVVHSGESWCSSCVKKENLKRCGDCNTWYPSGSLSEIAINFEERVYVCATCKERMMPCSHCNEGLIHPSFSRRDSEGGYLCTACHEEEQGMMPYYYKPTRLHFNTYPFEGKANSSTLFMGVEFELANQASSLDQNSLIHLIKERFGKDRFYGMHDGTIERATGNMGVEIVSHPFTWQDYRNNIATWDDFLLYIRSKGWRANLPGVGIHIHTTKSAWTTYQLYRLLRLIYDNKDIVCTIAQREPTEYCRMSDADEMAIAAVCKEKKNRTRDHYSAINLNTSNGQASNTIEFRMFQGTLEPLLFHKNVEFVKACYEYTREYAKPDGKKFIEYIESNRRIYPCLTEFIKGVRQKAFIKPKTTRRRN